MPDDPYAKVAPGQEVAFHARTWNDMLEAAQAERDRKRSTSSDVSEVYRQGAIVRVVNLSGASLSRGAVLGITGPLFSPAQNLPEFQSRVILKCATPAAGHAGKFVVLVEPAKNGAVARAAVAGVVQARVNVVSAAHPCADVVAGSSANLTSMATGGSARILWAAGTGVQWALIRFGNRCQS